MGIRKREKARGREEVEGGEEQKTRERRDDCKTLGGEKNSNFVSDIRVQLFFSELVNSAIWS